MQTNSFMLKLKLLSFITVIFLSGFSFNACENYKEKHFRPHWLKSYSHFKANDYEDYFQNNLKSQNDSDDVLKAYQQNDFSPFWTKNGLQENKVSDLLAFFEKAPEHGISPNFFDYDLIVSKIDSLKSTNVPVDDLYAYLFDLEQILSSNYVKYAKSMQFGAIDPKVVHGGKWYYVTYKADSSFVNNLLTNISDFKQLLEEIQPDNKEYKQLQSQLARFTDLHNSQIDKITFHKTIKKGQENADVKNVAKRLQIIGYKVDTSANVLNADLISQLNKFRKANNISESESLDSLSIEMLNNPERYIKKISANMERLRWKFKHNKTDDTIYIRVNIPDFKYYVYQNDSLKIEKNICCGRTQNPKGRKERYKNGIVVPYKAETPLIFSYIYSLTLNPEWNIPYDIIKNEYYPKLVKSNTACINKEHIYIKDSRTGEYVFPETIDWSKVPRSNIPYRLHQTSGKYNALGSVKFTFSNTESVYLHDTNNKSAFKRRNRALSHGCVRVENPLDLAEWMYEVNRFDTNYIERLHIILGDEPKTKKGEKYLEEREEKELEYYENLSDYDKQFYRKLRPTTIPLKKKIPLFIEYRTCYTDERGNIQYRDDVYYKDDNIWLLQNPDSDF